MAIAPVSRMPGMTGYKISSIHGNPNGLNPVQKVGKDTDKSGKPLVIASKEPEKNLYVKDFGELEKPKSMVSGDFAEMLSMQKSMTAEVDEEAEQALDNQQKQYTSYLNDTIGMMGFQNKVRDMLGGVSFAQF